MIFMECHICGARGERTKLFDTVIRECLVKVCEDCSRKENIHIIRRMDSSQVKEAEQNKSVYEKLSKMAGVDPVQHKAKFTNGRSRDVQNLSDLRDRKKAELTFSGLKPVESEFKDDLIRNYHWAIFKARRAMRLTQKQLADAISETEESVKYIERGVLPDNYSAFIKKIESCLGITLFKRPEKKQEVVEAPIENIEVEEKLPFFAAWKAKRRQRKQNKKLQYLEEVQVDLPDESNVDELTQEEIDRILFENK